MAAKKQDEANGSRWDDARLFLAAYRYKSLGAAALRLGLDTSTMSRRLTLFEDALGARLFTRTRDGLQPTHAAEHILAAAEAMEAAHARLTRDASDVESEAEGVVRLSVAPGMASEFVAPLLVRLRMRHPRICLELDAAVTPRDLSRREVDLALRSVTPQGAEIVTAKIATAQWMAAGSAALVKRLGKLSAWSDAPWLAWDKDLAHFPPARWLARYAPRAEVPLRTSHFSSQLVAARSGLGLILAPAAYFKPHKLVLARYHDSLAPSAAEWPTEDLWLAGHRSLREIPRVAAVWSFLVEEMRKTTAAPRAPNAQAALLRAAPRSRAKAR
jgi:DNA-binding transcriptional LysR family regulator